MASKSLQGSVSFKKRGKPGATTRKRPRTRNDEGDRALPGLEERKVNEAHEKKRARISDKKIICRDRQEDTTEVINEKERLEDKETKIKDQEDNRSLETKKKSSFGPQLPPKHIRTSISVDYQPDVCKDYKETGYCGFGDACKFLHDRTNYKGGWQLEKDWQTRQRERREAIMRGEDPDIEKKELHNNDQDGLPFACHICRGEFKTPVVTLCEHYFCEVCALRRMENDPTCAVCKSPLRGILNVAHKIVAKKKEIDFQSH